MITFPRLLQATVIATLATGWAANVVAQNQTAAAIAQAQQEAQANASQNQQTSEQIQADSQKSVMQNQKIQQDTHTTLIKINQETSTNSSASGGAGGAGAGGGGASGGGSGGSSGGGGSAAIAQQQQEAQQNANQNQQVQNQLQSETSQSAGQQHQILMDTNTKISETFGETNLNRSGVTNPATVDLLLNEINGGSGGSSGGGAGGSGSGGGGSSAGSAISGVGGSATSTANSATSAINAAASSINDQSGSTASSANDAAGAATSTANSAGSAIEQAASSVNAESSSNPSSSSAMETARSYNLDLLTLMMSADRGSGGDSGVGSGIAAAIAALGSVMGGAFDAGDSRFGEELPEFNDDDLPRYTPEGWLTATGQPWNVYDSWLSSDPSGQGLAYTAPDWARIMYGPMWSDTQPNDAAYQFDPTGYVNQPTPGGVAVGNVGFMSPEDAIELALAGDFSGLSRLLAQPFNVLVTWNNQVYDADLHMTGPQGLGRFHIYYASRGDLDESPFAALVQDCICTGGSEVILTTDLQQGGVYRVSIFNFGDQSFTSNNLSQGDVTVSIVRGGEAQGVGQGTTIVGGVPLATTTITPGQVGNTWTPFEINPATGQILLVDDVHNSNGSSNVD